MEQTVTRAASSPGPVDSHSSESDKSPSRSRKSSPVKDTKNLSDCEIDPAVGDNSEDRSRSRSTRTEISEEVKKNDSTENQEKCTTQGETETPDSSLLNEAVTNHEKTCGDAFDATIAICSIFNSTTEEETCEKSAEDRNAKDISGEFLITDLDSFSGEMTGERANSIESSSHSSSKIDVSYSNSLSPHSPQIILLDLQSQDEYVSDILSKGNERKKIKEEVDEFLNTSTDQIRTSSSDHFCLSDETMRDISDDESVLFRSSDGLYSPEYEYAREKKYHSDLQTSPIFFQDLNYDYEQMSSKPIDRIENTKTECDSIFYDPDYSQIRNETRNDKFYICPKMSTHVNSDEDLHGHDFSVNDSGFFDASYISTEKNFLTSRTQDLPVHMSNQIIGISKSNLNGQFLNSLVSVHSESNLSHSFKQSHYVNPHESSHLVSEAVSPTTPFGFAGNASPSYIHSLLHKQPLMDYGASYPQSLSSYAEVTEPCSLSTYPDWNSWSNVPNQELNVGSIPSSPYINSHLPQPKYIWHGDCNKIENAEIHPEYLKPAPTDNDSEETEDADEFDDVPLFFNTPPSFVAGYERQWISHSNSCYSDPPGSHFGSENMTPPPPASNTPSDTSSLYSPTDLSMSAACSKPLCEKMGSSLMPYEFVSGPKLPFPSMADMMRNSRSNASKASGITVKRILADAIPQGGRFRKSQIQSDTISTSTSKSVRYKRKWTTDSKRKEPDHISDMCINLDGLEEPELNQGPRRHNEPLNQQAIDIMSQWYEENLDNPYPTKADKQKMATEGGITVTQVKSWFANKRNRTNNTKPKVQKRAMEEKLKELFKDITCNRSIPLADNSHIIKQLSGIIQTCHSNKMD